MKRKETALKEVAKELIASLDRQDEARIKKKSFLSIKGVPLTLEFVRERDWYQGFLRSRNNGLFLTDAEISLGLRNAPSVEHVFAIFLHEFGHLEELLNAEPIFWQKTHDMKFREFISGATEEVMDWTEEREALAWVRAFELNDKMNLISMDTLFQAMVKCLVESIENVGLDYFEGFLEKFKKYFKEMMNDE